MTSNLITTVFSILGAVLLAGTVSAFLLDVSAVTVLSVALILLKMLLMFALGVYAGGRRIRIRRP